MAIFDMCAVSANAPDLSAAAADPRLVPTDRWSAIYQQHSRAVYYLALRTLRDPALAD